MKYLVAFALRRHFRSVITIIFNVLMLVMIVIGVNIDRLGVLPSQDIKTVYLDSSISSFYASFSRLSNPAFIYEESSEPLNKDVAILHFDQGWQVYSQAGINEKTLSALQQDLRLVITDRYLQQASPYTASYIQDYRQEIEQVITETGPDRADDYLWVLFTIVYFLIMGYGSSIANDIVYEKGTHMLELLLTKVSAQTHFKAKLASGYAILGLQNLFTGVVVAISLLIRYRYDKLAGLINGLNSLVNQTTLAVPTVGFQLTVNAIITAAVLMLIGVAAIQIILLVAASQFASEETASGMMNVFYLLLLLGYYVLVFYGHTAFLNTSLGQLLSYFPVSSMILMSARLLFCGAPLWQGWIAIGLGILFLALFTKYSMPLYQKGILNYHSR